MWRQATPIQASSGPHFSSMLCMGRLPLLWDQSAAVQRIGPPCNAAKQHHALGTLHAQYGRPGLLLWLS